MAKRIAYLIAACVLMMVGINMIGSGPAQASYDQGIARSAAQADPTIRNGRILPCRNPHSVATCTPTATAEPTLSPTNTPTPTDTPLVVPTDTAVPPTPTDTAVPPTATVQITPIASPTTCSGPDPYWSCVATVDEYEHEVARLINLHRGSPPHDPWFESGIALDFRADLTRAEQGHAEEMVEFNLCEHGDFGGRAAAEGYTGFAWGNIGSCGYENPANTVQGWIDSPAHHWVMDEAEAMTEFGVGAARYANNYWSTWVTIGCGGSIPCMAGAEAASMEQRAPAPLIGPGHGK